MSNLHASIRRVTTLAGFFGLTGIAFGALGAHWLAARLTESGMMRAWESGSRYHILHALALLGAAIWLRVAKGVAAQRVLWAARWWSVGIILFSASLYGLALGGPRILGPITPFGGVALMIGWAYVIAAAWVREE